MRCSFGLGLRNLCGGAAALLAFGIAIASPPIAAALTADESAAEIADHSSTDAAKDAKFADGWRKDIPLAEPNAQGKAPRCIAWVDEGWLIVERRDTAGAVEWQIVLAQVGEGDEPPTIKRNSEVPGGLRLDYRGGRFFIHDGFGRLRCVRQKKSAEVKWPALKIPANDGLLGGILGGRDDHMYYCHTHNGWQVVARGNKGEQAEYVLRMYCLEVGAFQLSSRADRSGVMELTVGATVRMVGSSTLQDDGELLVVRRMHEAALAIYRGLRDKLEANRTKLIGATAPEFSPAKWPRGRQVALDNLKGCAALVYFAGEFSKQVADQLSVINKLHGKYYVRGLEVVVVIPVEDEELFAAISEKRGWKFPLAVDGGQSRAVDRFYVTDSPSYFLIGRDGKIASGKYQEPIASGNAPRLLPLPGADEIEGLLGAAKP